LQPTIFAENKFSTVGADSRSGNHCSDEIGREPCARLRFGNSCSIVVRISRHSVAAFHVIKLLYFGWLYLTPKTNSKTFRKEDVNISNENSRRVQTNAGANNNSSFHPLSRVSSLAFQKAYRTIAHEVRSIDQSALHLRKSHCGKKACSRYRSAYRLAKTYVDSSRKPDTTQGKHWSQTKVNIIRKSNQKNEYKKRLDKARTTQRMAAKNEQKLTQVTTCRGQTQSIQNNMRNGKNWVY